MVKWEKIEETEHGTLFRSEMGSLKIQMRCGKCGKLVEGTARRGNWEGQRLFRRYIETGHPLALCSECAHALRWKRAMGRGRVEEIIK